MITRRDLIAIATTSTAMPGWLTQRAHGQTPHTQAWPTRFIRMVVPFPPGGGTDSVGRIVAARLSEMWGQQVVIENRGGAGSNLGSEAVARADPDGYTILFASLPLAINRFVYSSLSYDPVADFAPITLMCRFPNLMAVPNSSPAKSVGEFIAHAKQNPGLTFASSGIGTSPHLCGELFKRMANLEMTHVPYRGAGPALNDLIPGRVDMMFNTMGAMLPHARSGQVRALAVSTGQRFATVPDIPTVAESGLPGFDVSAWYALFAPAKTPRDIVARMNADTVAALADAGVKKKLEDLGLEVVGSTPDELGTMFQAEMAKWGPVIKAANITAQ
jgi:tripartite-type tricarboxylate transporter receptor subunit TctC